MTQAQWLLEGALVLLLAATLFHALRLERALGVLRRDRAVLEQLVSGFNGATLEAQASIDRLRGTADGAGRQIARQIDAAGALKEDLLFLIERGGQLADRMDALVRSARLASETRSNAALSESRGGASITAAQRPVAMADSEPAAPRVRSQAERDLLNALRMAR